MNFIWSWFGNKSETEVFELAKQNVVKFAIETLKTKQEKLHPVFYQKDLLLYILEEVRKDKKLFEENASAWIELLQFYKKDTPILLELLISFADELLNKNTEWENFIAGKQIPHPFNINMEVIYKLIEKIKPTGLVSRFDFHNYWGSFKPFMSFLRDICVVEKVSISVEEIENVKNRLRFTTIQKRAKKDPLQEQIQSKKLSLRKIN